MNSMTFMVRNEFFINGFEGFLNGTFCMMQSLNKEAKKNQRQPLDEVLTQLGIVTYDDNGNCVIEDTFYNYLDLCATSGIPITRNEYNYWKEHSKNHKDKSKEDVHPVCLNRTEGDGGLYTKYAEKLCTAAQYIYDTLKDYSNTKKELKDIVATEDDIILQLIEKLQIGSVDATDALSTYINGNYQVTYTNDSTAVIETYLRKTHKQQIFLPAPQVVGMKEEDIYLTFLRYITSLFNGASLTRCVSRYDYQGILIYTNRNLHLLLYNDADTIENLNNLDICRRTFQYLSLKEYFVGIYELGDVVKYSKDIYITGTISEKLLIFTSTGHIITEPKYLQTILSTISTVKFENDKPMVTKNNKTNSLWNVVIGNRSPQDGNYAHICDNNIL